MVGIGGPLHGFDDLAGIDNWERCASGASAQLAAEWSGSWQSGRGTLGTDPNGCRYARARAWTISDQSRERSAAA